MWICHLGTITSFAFLRSPMLGVKYGVPLNGVAGPKGQPVSIDDMTVQLVQHISNVTNQDH